MNTEATLQISSQSFEQTEDLAEKIGRNLRGGEVIELVSDLGGGKTTFVRGLARGAGTEDPVGSPTFMLSKVYKARKFDIHHFDFYRLGEAGIMGDELSELLGDPHVVVVMEWAEIVHDVVPTARLTIQIDRSSTSESTRLMTITYPDNLAYLVEPLKSEEQSA